MENYEVKKIVNLPYEEIDRIQEKINAENLEVIEQAYADRRITPEDRDYLLDFYHDGMGVYREVYRALYEMFKQPEYTCAIDLNTGRVDTDAQGNHINYGLKAVTPFTCTRLEYVDKFHNPIHVIFPKMKSATRAIEKLEKEYSKDGMQRMEQIADRFFRDEDRDTFTEQMQSINHNSRQLHDIVRLTITCKYFTDVERIKRLMTNNRTAQPRNFYINDSETRDLFLKPLSQNEKKYYDIKMIMHQKALEGQPLDVEVQLKIGTLYDADLRTHGVYEVVRRLEGDLETSRRDLPPAEIRQKEAQIKILKNRIRTINENAIHQYNMMVLDKARRIEDDGYRPLRIQPDNLDGTYQQCRNVISGEYMVESFEKFDSEKAFCADDERNRLAYLRMLGKIDKDFNETEPEAYKTVNYKFARLTLAEKERFKGINGIARRYASVIDTKIKSRRQSEMLGQKPKQNGGR
jgi:hypothetical protein